MSLNKEDIAEAALFGAGRATRAHVYSGWPHFPEFDYERGRGEGQRDARRGRIRARG